MLTGGLIIYYAGVHKSIETYYQEGYGLELAGLIAIIAGTGIAISARSDQYKAIHRYNAGLKLR